MLDKNDYELANPHVASLIQSLRAFGYDISCILQHSSAYCMVIGLKGRI